MTEPIENDPQAPDLSIVVPIYNEEENLRPLRDAIAHALDHGPLSYEVVLVDDCSTDGSRRVMQEMLVGDPKLRVVLFRRNYGQTAAMAVGFEHAKGNIVVTMDGDLQNDPADIPRLIEELERGHDIVCGWRRDRKDQVVTRLVPSRLANLLISWVTKVPIHDTGCSLKAYRGWVVRSLNLYSDMHRFIAALAVGAGARVSELPVRHHPRRFGQSKYGLGRILKVMADLVAVKMLIQFSAHPIRWFSLLSGLMLLSATGLFLLALFKIVDGRLVPSPVYDVFYISAFAITIMVTLNLFLLGFLAELQLKVSGFFRHRGAVLTDELRK